nr:hypothetical protein [Paenibacillus xylanexedens]
MNLTKLAAVQTLDINIDFETSDVFNHQNSIKGAILLIDQLNNRFSQENKLHKLIDFCDDYWSLYNPIQGCLEDIDFSFSSELVFNKSISKEELKITLKCWVLDRLIKNNLRASTVQTYFSHVKDSIIRTQIFLSNQIESYTEYLNDLRLADGPKHQIISSVLNFLSFYPYIPTVEQYTKSLHKVLNNLKPKSKSRVIPSGKDIITFSSILEDYFKVTEVQQKEYLHYFPLLLWWRITTVIPLRPFEFCAISPDCLVYEDNKVYLKLPRLKGDSIRNRNLRGKQLIDKILIPTSIEKLIQEYKDLIKKFNHTNRTTLISREVYESTLPSIDRKYIARKRLNDSFLTPDLSLLLLRFYNNIIHKQYGFSSTNLPPVGKKPLLQDHFEKDSDLIRVRVIDTRHIAFINMLNQGWSKPEIARFGGHLLLETQANYQYHQEYWIEIETRKLIQHFKLGMKISQIKTSDVDINDSFILSTRFDSALKKKFILRPPVTTVRKELKFGFCTDPNQQCRTHCYHCDYWRLSIDDINNHSQELKAFISESDHTLTGLFSFLKDLNRFVFEEELNPEISEKILSTQKKIGDEIHKRASLIYNTERSLEI